MQTFYDVGTFGLVGTPVVATAPKRQEGHTSSAHLVHRVQTVADECHVIVAFCQVLSIETTHGNGADLNAQRVGDVFEMCGLAVVAHFVVKHLALSQTAHVHLYAVTAQLTG